MIPEIIFIIPYRNRKEHKFFFYRHIKHVLEDIDPTTYEIYYAEQKDNRPFNRGAIKNIGFIAMMEKYKNNYQDITFVFNDVDCIPYTKNIIDYKTTRGTIKHFYGIHYLLGGIVSITGFDFYSINGFPNFWTWGYEDNYLQHRANYKKIITDRSTFFKMGNPNILHFFHGNIRPHDTRLNPTRKSPSGILSINNLNYEINNNIIEIHHFISKHDKIPTNTVKNIDISKKSYINDKKKIPTMNMYI